MATSADYLSSLLILAKNASEARKAAIDTTLKRATSGAFSKNPAGSNVYAPGTEGTLDVSYQRGNRNLEGSLESRGMLKSGEGATKRTDLFSDYQQAAMDLYSSTEANKAVEDSNYLQQEADYKMKYGTGTEATGEAPSVNLYPPSMANPQPDGGYAPQVNDFANAAGTAFGSPMGTYADPRYMKKPMIRKPVITKPVINKKTVVDKSTVRSPISRMVAQ